MYITGTLRKTEAEAELIVIFPPAVNVAFFCCQVPVPKPITVLLYH